MVMTLVIVLSNSMEEPITSNIVCFWLIQGFALFRPKCVGKDRVFWEEIYLILSLPIDDVKGF